MVPGVCKYQENLGSAIGTEIGKAIVVKLFRKIRKNEKKEWKV
jgi:hypothetical protein